MCDREYDEREYDERESYDISRTDDYNREFGGYKPGRFNSYESRREALEHSGIDADAFEHYDRDTRESILYENGFNADDFED